MLRFLPDAASASRISDLVECLDHVYTRPQLTSVSYRSIHSVQFSDVNNYMYRAPISGSQKILSMVREEDMQLREVTQKNFPNQTQPNYVCIYILSIDRGLRDSQFFVPNTANYGCPQIRHVDVVEQNLNVVYLRSRVSSSQGDSTLVLRIKEQHFEQRDIVSGFFGSRLMVLHFSRDYQ